MMKASLVAGRKEFGKRSFCSMGLEACYQMYDSNFSLGLNQRNGLSKNIVLSLAKAFAKFKFDMPEAYIPP